MSRPDSYILKLNIIKATVNQKKVISNQFLKVLNDEKSDVNYALSATDLEKQNINLLITAVENMVSCLDSVVWE